jgi:phage tail sheath gpL-like
MASATITISGLGNLDDFSHGPTDQIHQMYHLERLIHGVKNGQYAATVTISASSANAVRASGTLTISSGTGAVGGTIGGTAKTVTWATSDTASAAALATAINADTTINKLVTATSAAGVVTLAANVPGEVGNKILLVASGTGVTASAGGALQNGAGGATYTTYSLA